VRNKKKNKNKNKKMKKKTKKQKTSKKEKREEECIEKTEIRICIMFVLSTHFCPVFSYVMRSQLRKLPSNYRRPKFTKQEFYRYLIVTHENQIDQPMKTKIALRWN